MNSRLVLLMEEPFGPQEPCVLTTFCLDTRKQKDTSGVLGPKPRGRQMVPGIEDHTAINMRKERGRGGGTGTLSPFSPSSDYKGGESVALI
ncbi:hypothetical protein F7725_006722 [Dissostichus mawsoni]|uniref:Uncharacterized protein n=1 Tax=Dissostichus mawsoni TaxID=36200 RepID=A0A7J5XUQ3_DISMA|nr:hypothetical protein F7725_006722 [Dissostichus mawsoni]